MKFVGIVLMVIINLSSCTQVRHSRNECIGYRWGVDKKGRLSGRYVEYYPNGQIRVVGKYKKGNRFGVWRNFSADGQLMVAGKYKGDTVGLSSRLNLWKQLSSLSEALGEFENRSDSLRIVKVDCSTFIPEYVLQPSIIYTDSTIGIPDGRWLIRSDEGTWEEMLFEEGVFVK